MAGCCDVRTSLKTQTIHSSISASHCNCITSVLSSLHSCDKDNLPAEESNEMVTAVHVCAPIIVFSYKKNQVMNIQ